MTAKKNEVLSSEADQDVVEAPREYAATYELEYPIDAIGDDGQPETINTLYLRRPTLLDKILAEKQSKDGSSYQGTATMLGNVCGVMPDTIYELDEEYDLVRLVEKFNGFEEEPEVAGENTLVLKYPFEANGKKITKLTVRRPKARDSLEYGDESLGDKIARLCGYEQKDLYSMDLKTDWMGLEKIYVGFRKRKPKRQ